jgi:hypothetical protein
MGFLMSGVGCQSVQTPERQAEGRGRCAELVAERLWPHGKVRRRHAAQNQGFTVINLDPTPWSKSDLAMEKRGRVVVSR